MPLIMPPSDHTRDPEVKAYEVVALKAELTFLNQRLAEVRSQGVVGDIGTEASVRLLTEQRQEKVNRLTKLGVQVQG